jgi:glycosyltransferase involved in cell wall biosynthesis
MKDHHTLFSAYSQSELREMGLRCAGMDVTTENPLIASALAGVRPAARSNIELLGSVEDPQPLLREAAALVISSSYGEALPMAALEALAHGIPVVTTDVGDCAQAAVDPLLLVAPRDPAGLARAMRYLATAEQSVTDHLRSAAMTTAQRFDIRNTVSAYARVYEQVLRAK